MALTFKSGVKLNKLQPQMIIALQIAEKEFSRYGLDTVVTSANDGEHKQGSKHYSGTAVDLRTKHAPGVMKGIFNAIKATLAPIGFDVLWEDPDGLNQHLHLEWDPK